MKYDDASWHSGGEFPVGSPPEYGGTHIGLFLRWCFGRGWAGKIHTQDPAAAAAVKQVMAGELSGTRFLFSYCDGKFTDRDLSAEGNAFAKAYYDAGDRYLLDYAGAFEAQMYTASEEQHDSGTLNRLIEKRYAEFKAGTLPGP